MRMRLFGSAGAVARTLASDIVRAVQSNPAVVFGLPTGRTPIPLYRELARAHARGDVDFSRVQTFNLDEFVGVGAANPSSYRAFMHRQLFDHVNIPPRNIHFLNGAARNLAAECARYERAIARAGGIDLLILGLGANGHIGFNEPDVRLHGRTHVAALRASTRKANVRLFAGSLRRTPRRALSMGMVTILHAARIAIVATGAAKARCVEGMVNGPLTTRLPASFLQLHRRVEVWLDSAAASRL